MMNKAYGIGSERSIRIILIVIAFLVSLLIYDSIMLPAETQVYAFSRASASRYCKGTKKCPRYTKKADAVKAIKRAVKNRKKTVSFYYKSKGFKSSSYFTEGLFYLIDGIKYTKSVDVTYLYRSGRWNVKNSICYYYKFYFSYRYTPEQEKKYKKALYAVSNSLYGSAEDKIRQFDQYMIDNCVYDYDLYYGKDKSKNDSTNGYSAYSALVKGKAVCNGYAEAGEAVLKLAGVKSSYVSGSAGGADGKDWGGHAWNMVKVGKKWYSCDFCWDSCRQDQAYLLKGTGNKYFWSRHKLGGKYASKEWKKKHPMAKGDLVIAEEEDEKEFTPETKLTLSSIGGYGE